MENLVNTPTIDKYAELHMRGSKRAYRQFQKKFDEWLVAYKDHDINRMERLGKERDRLQRRANKAYKEAERFLKGVYGLWDVKTV